MERRRVDAYFGKIMFRRKLTALGFHNPDNFSAHDENEFRNMIVWLEDKVIRLYKIEDRSLLREVNSKDWNVVLDKYLEDLACPVQRSDRNSITGWLLSHAIRLEYHADSAKYNAEYLERAKHKVQDANEIKYVQSNSGTIGEITGDDPDLKAGVASLSKLLGIPFHPDHMTTLQAVQKVIEQRLSVLKLEALKAENGKKKTKMRGDDQPISEVDLGFQVNDSAVNEAAKILRLLHLHELRDLQTQINKAIVLVQRSTANPKTDQSLGKVGW